MSTKVDLSTARQLAKVMIESYSPPDYQLTVANLLIDMAESIERLHGEVARLQSERDAPDIYELRERGLRVLDSDQCCLLACSGGGCETCPCCCAGWCVTGADELPDPITDAENYSIWLTEAAEHNATAKRLATVEAELSRVRAEVTAAKADALEQAADDFEVPGNGIYVSPFEQQTFAIVRQDLAEQLRKRAADTRAELGDS